MKKNLLYLLILISACCQDEIVYSNKLTEFEKSLIPYNSFDNSYFLDETGNTIRASFDPRIYENSTERDGLDSCLLKEYESLNGAFRFISRNLELTLNLKSSYEKRQFKINEYYYGSDNFGIDFFQGGEDIFENIFFDLRLENVTLLNFEYIDVIVLENFSGESQIDKIIVSPQKGIEFILYKNESYLKLIE
jgi:hypothetical protein